MVMDLQDVNSTLDDAVAKSQIRLFGSSSQPLTVGPENDEDEEEESSDEGSDDDDEELEDEEDEEGRCSHELAGGACGGLIPALRFLLR